MIGGDRGIAPPCGRLIPNVFSQCHDFPAVHGIPNFRASLSTQATHPLSLRVSLTPHLTRYLVIQFTPSKGALFITAPSRFSSTIRCGNYPSLVVRMSSPAPQKSSRAYSRLNALPPSYLENVIVGDNPVVVRIDDAASTILA